MASKRLSWRKEPNKKGLARVTQGPRGYDLWEGDQRLAHIAHWRTGGFKRSYPGGFYAYGDLIPGHNNYDPEKPTYETLEQAKQEIMKYAKSK